jgi:hypothetical protein
VAQAGMNSGFAYPIRLGSVIDIAGINVTSINAIKMAI